MSVSLEISNGRFFAQEKGDSENLLKRDKPGGRLSLLDYSLLARVWGDTSCMLLLSSVSGKDSRN